MSRAKYLKYLERDLEVSTKVIDDLTRENFELKELLKALNPQYVRSTQSQNSQATA